ncbi:MAG TPA: VWA domain-containing protein, partial [Geminicoccus sp.]|uniref:VWA domain-containing protein n=1 Tax=Geminicoccus sp. TaxID=2024832 RepID=UPI002C52D08C
VVHGCSGEIEPNDLPEQAQPLDGAICVMGSGASGSDQYHWHAGDSAEAAFWRVRVQGMPGQSTRLALSRLHGAAPEVQADYLGTLDASGQEPDLTLPPLLLQDDTLALEIGTGGGLGLYRIMTERLDTLPPRRDAAGTPLADDFELTLDGAETTHVLDWELDADAAGKHWDLTLQARPGFEAELRLLGPAGQDVLQPAVRRWWLGQRRLEDLVLQPGRYQLELDRPTQTPLVVKAHARPAAPGEHEPNDSTETAEAWDGTGPLSGRLLAGGPGQDVDLIRLEASGPALPARTALVVRTDRPDATITVGLQSPEGEELMQRSGAGEIRLPGLATERWPLIVKLAGAPPADLAWTMHLEEELPPLPGQEAEPDDRIAQASPFGPNGIAVGQLSPEDTDQRLLQVNGDLGLWRVVGEGRGLRRLALLDATGNRIAVAERMDDSQPLRLSNLVLSEGPHVLEARGETGAYRLVAERSGPAPYEIVGAAGASMEAGGVDEIEPDDDPALARELPFGIARRGLIDRIGDTDQFGFFLEGTTPIRLTIAADDDVRRVVTLSWGGDRARVARFETAASATGQRAVWDGMLAQGEWLVSVTAAAPSDQAYTLELQRRRLLAQPADLEPNDSASTARPVPVDGRLGGSVGPADEDWFVVPTAVQEGELVVRPEPGSDPAGLTLRLGRIVQQGTKPEAAWQGGDAEPGVDGAWRVRLPAGEPALLRVASGRSMDYRLEVDGRDLGWQPIPPAFLPAALALEHAEIAALAADGQVVHGTLRLGPSPVAASLTLQPSATDDRWRVELGAREAVLDAGGTLEVPVTIHVAPDAAPDLPVSIAITATGAEMAGGAEADLVARLDAAPTRPTRWMVYPKVLQGTIDAAWDALGGQTDAATTGLIDGLVNEGGAVRLQRDGEGFAAATVTLPGDAPLPVAGFAIDVRSFPSMAERLSRFVLETSLDGVTWQEAMSGELSPRPGPQPFALKAPKLARAVRLVPLMAQGGPLVDTVTLGELEVLVAQSAFPIPERGFDVAGEAVGGRLERIDPWDYGAEAMLSDLPQMVRVSLPAERSDGPSWVIGFRHGRTAQLAAVEWQDAPGSEPTAQLPRVRLAVSSESPDGPWIEAGDWILDRRPDGTVAPFVFPAPVTARWLRVAADRPLADQGYAELPGRFSVRESTDWSSILAVEEPSAIDADEQLVAAPPGPGTALESGAAAAGLASLDREPDRYPLDISADVRHVRLVVRGQPTADVGIRMIDPAGQPVALRVEQDDPSERRWSAEVTPGRYLVEVFGLPRSVVLAWDTSGSVGAFVPAIIRGVRSFVRDVAPGRDEAQLMPFGEPQARGLLPDWSGNPGMLFAKLQTYRWDDSSSSAEGGLLGAAEALAARPGIRAAIIVTDGQTSGEALRPDLWAALTAVWPRVFTIGTPTFSQGTEARAELALLEGWANSSGGRFTRVGDAGELSRAIATAVARLRRPIPFTLAVELAAEPPPPARIRVVQPPPDAGTSAAPPRQAVSIVLDTSGSMLQRLDGKRRIEIAKEVLTDLANQDLAPGTPVALRVFGQGGRGSCRSDLALPLAPLDRSAMVAAVQGLTATDGARTPIAASLEAAAQDLAAAQGPRTVVLITDGEETCDGDPLAAVQALRASGIAVRLNIVGFAVDQPVVASMFRSWAEAGGGAYFSADDADGLARAVREASSTPFEVIDGQGTSVARGTVDGEAVSIAAGRYRIRPLDGALPELGPLDLAPGEERSLQLR